jgi:hypothetical protein
MKLKTFVSGLALATTAAVIAVPSHAGVKYDGDSKAAAVCKAVVEDDTAALKKAFRQAGSEFRRSNFVGNIEETFLCNGKPLAAFASQMGAYAVLSELDGASEDQVASTR